MEIQNQSVGRSLSPFAAHADLTSAIRIQFGDALASSRCEIASLQPQVGGGALHLSVGVLSNLMLCNAFHAD